MDFHSQAFFCGKQHYPVCTMYKLVHSTWPITINISDRYSNSSGISFHLASEQDLINFKNSVIEAYESFVRRRKEVSKE